MLHQLDICYNDFRRDAVWTIGRTGRRLPHGVSAECFEMQF